MPLSSFWSFLAGRPDFAQLGNRLFLVDGINPNLVLCEGGELREMGCAPQRAELVLTQSGDTSPGEHLTALATYTWGLQRILTDGTLEIPSAMTLQTSTMTGTNNQAAVVMEAYPLTPPTGWSVKYRIWRSQANVPETLYFVIELSAYQSQYVDNHADSTLDLSRSYIISASSGNDNIAVADPNYQLPPVRFIREWKGKLVAGGSVPYAAGTLATVKDSLTVTLTNGVVRSTDVDGELRITGEPGYFLITAANSTAHTWTLNRVATVTNAAATYVMQHTSDMLHITNPLPDNIEGYELGTEVYAAQGTGNRLTGLAEQSGMLYVLREHRVDTLEPNGDTYSLEPLPDSPPGCVSNATIADKFSPRVYYYAGRSGVWELSGSKARRVSLPVQLILDKEVLHELDSFTHAVYDPFTGLYHLWLFKTGDFIADTFLMPSLLLTYDTLRDQWYRGELSASASGIWKDSSGAPYPVIGIPGGVARLDVAESACDVQAVNGSATTGSTTSVLQAIGTPFAGKDLRGLPLLVNGERRIISSHTSSALTIFGTFTSAPASGATFSVGAIRWAFKTGEIAFTEKQETRKKFHRLFVSHEPASVSSTITTTVRGMRADAAHYITNTGEMLNVDEQIIKGAELGMRGNSCQVDVSGTTLTERHKVVGLILEEVLAK